MNKKNVLYIWDADYPWDIRVEKICLSLIKKGYNAHIAARNLKKLPEYEKINGIDVHRIKPRCNSRLNYVLSFPAFFNPVWKNFLDKIISENQIDLIIVRDLPMAIGGIWAGKRNNLPVIFDMAEDYVAMLRDIWKLRKFQGLNLLVRNPYFAKYIESYTLRKINHIFVVIDEAKDLLVSYGVNENKISIVSNTPRKNDFRKKENLNDTVLNEIENRLAIIYTGGIQMGRGIQVVLEALPGIVEDNPDALFVVIGDGYALETFKEHTISIGLNDYVKWLGWIEHQNLYQYLGASDIGIVPHLTTDHVNTTIPNKIFDYMGSGLVVISSDSRPLKRILSEENCGVTYESGNAADLRVAVSKAINRKKAMKKNGIRAVNTKYNWEHDEKKLFAIIDKII